MFAPPLHLVAYTHPGRVYAAAWHQTSFYFLWIWEGSVHGWFFILFCWQDFLFIFPLACTVHFLLLSYGCSHWKCHILSAADVGLIVTRIFITSSILLYLLWYGNLYFWLLIKTVWLYFYSWLQLHYPSFYVLTYMQNLSCHCSIQPVLHHCCECAHYSNLTVAITNSNITIYYCINILFQYP